MRLMGENDEVLWDMCTAGDADAFAVLFDRHVDAVFRCSLSILSNPVRFLALCGRAGFDHFPGGLEAWRQRNRLKPEKDTVLPWLLGVATNADRHRARPFRRHVQFVSRLPHSDPRSGENQADHAEAVASRVDTERAVREMLDTVAVLQAKCLYESKARLLKEGEKQPVPH
jgi:hypothetical protein